MERGYVGSFHDGSLVVVRYQVRGVRSRQCQSLLAEPSQNVDYMRRSGELTELTAETVRLGRAYCPAAACQPRREGHGAGTYCERVGVDGRLWRRTIAHAGRGTGVRLERGDRRV